MLYTFSQLCWIQFSCPLTSTRNFTNNFILSSVCSFLGNPASSAANLRSAVTQPRGQFTEDANFVLSVFLLMAAVEVSGVNHVEKGTRENLLNFLAKRRKTNFAVLIESFPLPLETESNWNHYTIYCQSTLYTVALSNFTLLPKSSCHTPELNSCFVATEYGPTRQSCRLSGGLNKNGNGINVQYWSIQYLYIPICHYSRKKCGLDGNEQKF